MTEVAKLQPTRDTEYHIKQWVDMAQRAESLKRQHSTAVHDLLDVTNELGRFLSPKDAKIGETFNIWYGDGLLAITKTDDNGSGSYTVAWRTRPREMPHR